MSTITINTITPDTTGNDHLDTGVKADGDTGGATSITVQALFNGMSFGQADADVNGSSWTCEIKNQFTPPGSLTIKAVDDDGKVGSAKKTVSV